MIKIRNQFSQLSLFESDMMEVQQDRTVITQPDESYTIQELVSRAKLGNVPQLERPGQYLDDANLDSIDYESIVRMDVFERDRFRAEHAEKVAEMLSKKRELDSQAEKMAFDAKVQEAVNAKLKAKEPAKDPLKE